jgi:glycosyltransferase involved in cell wall biosynthesis
MSGSPLRIVSHREPTTKTMAQDPLCLLCVEPYFPGRLGAVADWLIRRRGYRVHFYCHQVEPQELWPETVGRGLELITYNVGGVAKETSVHWSRGLERGLCYAYGAWEVYDVRRPRPVDLVLGRSVGLGSNLFSSVSYPGVPRVNFYDYYYLAHQHDLAGEAPPETPAEYFLWRKSANAMDLLDLENGGTPWAPTSWQRDLYPPEYRDDFTVLYDGVDSRKFTRAHERPRNFLGRSIEPGMKVVSFVCNAPDSLRGFERFVALSNRLLKTRSDVVCVVIGGGPVSRMLDVRYHSQNYVKICLENDPPADPARFWNLGLCAPNVVAELLNSSDVHVYPSRPYSVATSMVEAMSSGSVVLAWDSDPVREFVDDGETGLIVPPDDLDAAEKAANAILDDVDRREAIGAAAAKAVRQRFSQDVCLPKLAEMFDRLRTRTTP